MTKPEARFKAGGCSAAVFVNQFETAAGPKVAKNVVLERTYKDKDGSFQTSRSLSVNDIPRAILVLQKAYEHIVMQQGEPKSVPKQAQDLSSEPSY